MQFTRSLVTVIALLGLIANAPAIASDSANPVRPTAGEILPQFSNPNLLPNGDFDQEQAGWNISLPISDEAAAAHIASSEHGPVLRLTKGDDDSHISVISQVIPVKPNTDYLLTGLYHTASAEFGGMTDFVVIQGDDEQALENVTPARPDRYAHPGYSLLLNAPDGQWRRKTRTFRTSGNTTALRIAIVLAGPTMTVDYDNLYLAESEPDTREWDWPEHEGRISQVQTRKRLAARPNSKAEVRHEHGAARLYIDDQLQVPQVQMTDVTRPERGYISDFASHGLNIHMVTIKKGSTGFWRGHDDLNFDVIDEVMWDAVQRDPEGNFIVYFSARPYTSWHEDNPEHAAQHADGTYAVSRHARYAPPSYFSKAYQEQVYDVLEQAVTHIHSQPYGRAVVGYFITGGEDGQFYYQAGRNGVIEDGQGAGDMAAFREWLRTQYRSVDELRKAWNDLDMTFDNAQPRTSQSKYLGNFLHPIEHRREVDTFTFLNDEVGQFLVNMGRICKEAAGKPIITGAYYGRGRSAMVYPHFAQTRVVLQSPYLDYMGAQGGYYGWREAGNSGRMDWVHDSLRLHGKIPMMELDFRTWISEYKSMEHDYKVARYWNMDEFVGAARRDVGNMIAIDGGVWWMEMSGGWFRDESIMQPIGQMHQTGQAFAQTPRPQGDKPEIVFVVDEDSYLWTTEQINIWNGPNYHSNAVQQPAIARSGLRYNMYYLSDLIEQQMDDYKVYVFLNVYQVDERKRAFLNSLKRNGKVLVWQYAAGYITPEGFSDESMSELTGIDLKLAADKRRRPLRAHFIAPERRDAEAQRVLTNITSPVMGFGRDLYGQRFIVDDSQAHVLGRYVVDRAPAAAIKRLDDHTSIYIGHPSGLTDQLLNNIARIAGVHVHTEPGDVFMSNRADFIMVHGVKGGERTIRLPHRATVVDVLDGQVLAEDTTEITFPLSVNETRWLRIEK